MFVIHIILLLLLLLLLLIVINFDNSSDCNETVRISGQEPSANTKVRRNEFLFNSIRVRQTKFLEAQICAMQIIQIRNYVTGKGS